MLFNGRLINTNRSFLLLSPMSSFAIVGYSSSPATGIQRFLHYSDDIVADAIIHHSQIASRTISQMCYCIPFLLFWSRHLMLSPLPAGLALREGVRFRLALHVCLPPLCFTFSWIPFAWSLHLQTQILAHSGPKQMDQRHSQSLVSKASHSGP